jgi:hypothetical protein
MLVHAIPPAFVVDAVSDHFDPLWIAIGGAVGAMALPRLPGEAKYSSSVQGFGFGYFAARIAAMNRPVATVIGLAAGVIAWKLDVQDPEELPAAGGRDGLGHIGPVTGAHTHIFRTATPYTAGYPGPRGSEFPSSWYSFTPYFYLD